MQLTNNFRLMEFNCKDGTRVPEMYMNNVRDLANALQVIRDEIKAPLYISSGYRSPSHNRRVGGAANSQHLTASAADISTKNLTPAELKEVIEGLITEDKIKIGGIGLYKGFVHVDIRSGKARW